jgi:hypothetical protein
MLVELGWQVEFDFKVKLVWGCVGEVHPKLCRGVEESGCVKVVMRDKIRVCLKNEITQNSEIKVGFRSN